MMKIRRNVYHHNPFREKATFNTVVYLNGFSYNFSSSVMDVDQVEHENKDADNTLETVALFVTQYIQSTSTSLRKDVYTLLPFFCQFVGKNCLIRLEEM